MSGRVDELKGSVKEAAGDALGNERMQAEGKAQRLSGEAEREASGARDQLAGNVKRGAGELLDDERMEAEGEAQRHKGEAQRAG